MLDRSDREAGVEGQAVVIRRRGRRVMNDCIEAISTRLTIPTLVRGWRCVPRKLSIASLAMVAVLLAACDDAIAPEPPLPAAATFDSAVPRDWFALALRLTRRTAGFSPPVASRAFAYLGVALYEALVPGMPGYRSLAGQVNALDPVPAPESGAQYHWALVANSVLAASARLLYPTASVADQAVVDSIESAWVSHFRSETTPEVAARSASRGRAVAYAIFAWSVRDAGHEAFLRNFPPDYVPPAGPGMWVPTPRLNGMPPLAALQPRWGACRPFVLPHGNPNRDCAPSAPPAFSTDPASAFYAEAFEVYDRVNNATAEEQAIALFWADDPGVTATPPGHSISILTQVLLERGASLAVAAEAYAKVGMAVADAFIACWQTKYAYNLLRPVTYIRDHIQADWLPPLLDTPPFPEYTSGHSVQSAAAARVLTWLFGADYSFTDHTHDARGLAPRSFASFDDAAREAADSRLYGGIHYRAAIDRGLEQGACIGDRVNALVFRSPS